MRCNSGSEGECYTSVDKLSATCHLYADIKICSLVTVMCHDFNCRQMWGTASCARDLIFVVNWNQYDCHKHQNPFSTQMLVWSHWFQELMKYQW
jgi:hypothetical protein